MSGSARVALGSAGASERSEDVRVGLAEAGRRRADAERARAEAMADLTRWLRRGRGAGLPVTELARLAGVTRQTVYDLT